MRIMLMGQNYYESFVREREAHKDIEKDIYYRFMRKPIQKLTTFYLDVEYEKFFWRVSTSVMEAHLNFY